MATKTDDQANLPPYIPTDEEKETIRCVEDFYTQGLANRQPHEGQWFVTTSFIRGNQYVEWDSSQRKLSTPPAPAHRIRRTFNLMLPKVRARQAKFLKNRPIPEVRPATQDIKDILDARMTTKALAFLWRKLRMEDKYFHALQWCSQTGHGYWWFSWDPTALGQVQLKDEMTGKVSVQEGVLGEIEIEVDSPLGVLIADPSIPQLGKQPAIMRLRRRPKDYLEARYPEKAKFVQMDAEDSSFRDYEKSIGELRTASSSPPLGAPTGKVGNDSKKVTVKEYFERSTAKHQKGRYQVVAGGVLLKDQPELPYEMWKLEHPYPVVDFPDQGAAGQYWIATLAEQLIPPQKQYNLLRSRLEEHLKLMIHGKIIVAKQHQMAPGAWSSEAGEIIEYVAHPSIPPPQTWSPPPISRDIWEALNLLTREMDSISHIYPEAEGRIGQASSGFQTNLLQEATDAVHAPDIRVHERAIEEAAIKCRHIMKRMYSVPRLISITTADSSTEAFEFSQEDIDEAADVVVDAGSGLPNLKGAKIQMALELRNAGLFGNPQDPEVNRKVLTMLDMGEVNVVYADARRDEERARLENISLGEGTPVIPPLFCDNHDIHYRSHTDQMKSSEFPQWEEEKQVALIDHLLIHAVFINPQAAMQIGAIYNRPVPTMPGMPPAQPGPAAPPQGEQPPDPSQGMGAPPEAAMAGDNQANAEFGFGPSGINPTMTPPV